MATTKPKITLYVDIVSPFAYMAYYILRHDPVFANCDVKYIPIFLGGLMHKCGNTAPMNIKNKDKYISLERLRWSSAFSIPIATEMPPDFPALTLPTMRALAVLYEEGGGVDGDQSKLVAALDALYAATWVERRATHKVDVLRGVLGGVLGVEEAERVLQASTTTGKALLLKLTDSAFDAGAFGLPWMVCTNPGTGATEGFWGVDHLGQVAQFLDLPIPKTAGDKAGWRALL
ncbi:thioredoxin-like protein [Schizothecium vesticola]|uniref:Glutathione S-transferase kappa n=1 Tax=Schizothecium vesticola TaxID=314040 RepID=A0AA40EK77_9PEZI|nr:thioredoxin-like protein [Schizothecium vesticola]